MRTLLLLRHGKSDWNVPGQADHERALNPRGIAAARLMGRFITATIGAPDRVLTSSAVRARTTAQLAAEAGGWHRAPELSDALYDSTVEVVLREAAQASDDMTSQLLVGHQPVWSETVSRLIGGGELHMSTAALACIRLSVSRWADLPRARGVLAWFVAPKLMEPIANGLPTE